MNWMNRDLEKTKITHYMGTLMFYFLGIFSCGYGIDYTLRNGDMAGIVIFLVLSIACLIAGRLYERLAMKKAQNRGLEA